MTTHCTAKMHEFNWDKVKTVEDIKRILSALDIKIGPGYKNYDCIKDLLVGCTNDND